MSAWDLAQAIRALVPESVTRHDGEARPDPALLPWVVLNQSVPNIDSRSEAGPAHGMTGRAYLTIAGESEDAVLAIADIVLPAFEGARVTIPDHSVSPLRRIGEVKIFPDPDVRLPSGLHVQAGKATYEYTVTRTT